MAEFDDSEHPDDHWHRGFVVNAHSLDASGRPVKAQIGFTQSNYARRLSEHDPDAGTLTARIHVDGKLAAVLLTRSDVKKIVEGLQGFADNGILGRKS